jgi:hypothetical protein
VAPGVSCRPCRDSLRFLPLFYSLQPTASSLPREFLRNSGFLRQQTGVERRLYMVK